MQEIIDKFLNAMTAAGCVPASAADIKDTGGVDTYIKLAGERDKGKLVFALKIEPDGFAWGNARNFKTGEHMSWHSKKGAKGLTPEERKAYAERVKKAEAEAEAERVKRATKAAADCQARWKAAKPATEHDYLTRKGIQPHGVRLDGDSLLIARYNDKGRICSLQEIRPDGSKRFAYGATTGGTYYPIAAKGDDTSTVAIAEGFATGATVREAKGWPVAVAFDCGNLKAVAKVMRGKYPDARLVLCADNDHKTTNAKGEPWNPGIEKAQQAAVAVGGFVVAPEFAAEDEGTDWNDYAAQHGIDKTREALQVPEPLPPAVVDEPPHWDEVPDYVLEEAAREGEAATDISWMERAFWKNEKAGVYDDKHANYNAELILTYENGVGGCFVLDVFADQVTIVKPLPWDDRRFNMRLLDNNDIIRLRSLLESKGLRMAKGCVKDAVFAAAWNRQINPAQDYLKSLVWDGKARLDNWLITYLGAKDQEADYVRRVGACWVIAAAKRIFEPGAPFHHMLVLEGGQAAGKSTALRTLATFGRDRPIEYFSDRVTFDHIDKSDFASFAAGHVILEFQELSGMGKKDRNKIKQWITQTIDEYRKPYEAVPTRFPRQFVLAGTTNETQWLTDPTGDRRFWPVKVADRLDTDGLMRDREQLWAEAVHRYRAGELWYIKPEDPVYKLMQNEQAIRNIGDPWEDAIMSGLTGLRTTTIDYVFTDILHIQKDRWDQRSRTRIADTLTKNGWENKSVYCSHTKKSKRQWIKSDVPEQASFEEEIAW